MGRAAFQLNTCLGTVGRPNFVGAQSDSFRRDGRVVIEQNGDFGKSCVSLIGIEPSNCMCSVHNSGDTCIAVDGWFDLVSSSSIRQGSIFRRFKRSAAARLRCSRSPRPRGKARGKVPRRLSRSVSCRLRRSTTMATLRNIDALLARSDITAAPSLLSSQYRCIPRSSRRCLRRGNMSSARSPSRPASLLIEYNEKYRKNLVWRVAENFEADTGLRPAHGAIAAGRIGKVKIIQGGSHEAGRIPPEASVLLDPRGCHKVPNVAITRSVSNLGEGTARQQSSVPRKTLPCAGPTTREPREGTARMNVEEGKKLDCDLRMEFR
ncbi:hypothetical protein GGX14DRAFT_596717 [Mycena pura]|uniref:Uncharacterized protein n=1 Tax=Mycena pura TaxID=153505 RepID=A0AAD6UPH0_9AGAR|nr:hypothetical protein GGX14DRAFT_596717 [Mycena pura]